MNIDHATQCIDLPPAVTTTLIAAEPEDATEDPVTLRIATGERITVQLPARATPDKDRIGGATGTDPDANMVTTARGTATAEALPNPIARTGDGVDPGLRRGAMELELLICNGDFDADQGADQSRKLLNCNGTGRLSSRSSAITACRSSRFLPVTRTFSP
jgi:hypothetical protein